MDRARNSKNFRVVLRLCPPEPSEIQTGSETRASVRVIGMNRVTVDTGKGHRAHVLDFDAVWNEGASPRDVYESTAKPLVEYLMNGYNGCMVSFGPTTSAETKSVKTAGIRQRGIISRAAEDIFNSPEASHSRVRVSFYHVSNEKIYDLLEPQTSEICRVHDTEEAVLLEGLRETEVDSAQDLMKAYQSGTAHRNAGVSKGDFASKSHLVFNIWVINMAQSCKEGVLRASKLTLVDLASSSKAAYHSSATLDTRKSIRAAPENPQDAKILKRSLTNFRNVIFSLSTPGCQHVPYRESKLTRVMRDCLGGNCRTCLLVTVPSQSFSANETMSCLQFAAQAMNIPSRTIHSSQIHYTPTKLQNMWTTEKNSHLLTRTQTLPPVNADRRSQTCLPPIVTSPGPLVQPKPKCSLERSESRSFLPFLENPKASGHHSRASQITEQRSANMDVCGVKSPISVSRCLSGAVFPEPLRRRSVETFPSSSLGCSSFPPQLLECPNCKQERKIREEYDKFIVQVERDRDGLSQRVTELEKELKKIQNGRVESEIRQAGSGHGGNETEDEPGNDERREWSARRESGAKERAAEQGNGGEGEKESDTAGKESTSTPHEATEARKTTERALLTQNALTDPEKERDMRAQCSPSLHVSMESLLSELHSVRDEYEGLRKSAALSVTQLQKEKAELISHIDDAKNCYDKVCLENADLKSRLEALLKEANSGPSSTCNCETSHMPLDSRLSPAGSHSLHTHTVTTNTEMLVMSHSVCQRCTAGLPQGSRCCFSLCSGFSESPESGFSERPNETTSHTYRCEPALHKASLYKQLRREHSLLLDVMLVLYRREWFLQDAMPYVRRTLKKCGLNLEDTD